MQQFNCVLWPTNFSLLPSPFFSTFFTRSVTIVVFFCSTISTFHICVSVAVSLNAYPNKGVYAGAGRLYFRKPPCLLYVPSSFINILQESKAQLRFFWNLYSILHTMVISSPVFFPVCYLPMCGIPKLPITAPF